MQVMHEAGLAHCDLKPANIVLMPDGCTKLADFGAACAINSYTGRLATMHGNGLRDKEIERLMKNHMTQNTRTTDDHPSAFGSLWDILDQDNQYRPSSSALGSARGASGSEVHQDTDAINRTQAGSEQDTWKVPDSSTSDTQLSPFVLQQPSLQRAADPSENRASKEPGVLPTHAETEPQKDEEHNQREELVEANGMCQGREDYMRHTATQSALLRSFKSCPGSSLTSPGPDSGDTKGDRRVVRWFSGAGGSSLGPKTLQQSRTADENLFATRPSLASRNSCSSPIKAYSLRDVPMVRPYPMIQHRALSCPWRMVLKRGSIESFELPRKWRLFALMLKICVPCSRLFAVMCLAIQWHMHHKLHLSFRITTQF